MKTCLLSSLVSFKSVRIDVNFDMHLRYYLLCTITQIDEAATIYGSTSSCYTAGVAVGFSTITSRSTESLQGKKVFA